MAVTFTNKSGAPIGLWDTSSVYHVVAPHGGSVTIEPTVAAQDLIAACVSAGYATTIELAKPVNSVAPAITGSETVAETLTADSGTWTGAPTPTYAYQWQSSDNGTTGWTNITGAKSATYEIQAADESKFLRCTVTATNTLGSVKAQSNATGAIAGA